MIKKIFKKKHENVELYLNSEDEKFKLVYINANLTYNHESWRSDKILFEEPYRDFLADKLSSGQTYLTVACLSVSEYMEVYSYMIRNGWSKRIRWSEEFKKRFDFDYWDKYVSVDERKLGLQDFADLLGRRSSMWGLAFEESDPSLYIDIMVDLKSLDEFRNLIKGLSKFGYKAAWYKEKNTIQVI